MSANNLSEREALPSGLLGFAFVDCVVYKAKTSLRGKASYGSLRRQLSPQILRGDQASSLPRGSAAVGTRATSHPQP